VKRITVWSIVLVLAGTAFAAAAQSAKKPAKKAPAGLATKIERKSYVLGLDVGRNLKEVPGDLDMKALVKGIEDSLHGKKPRLSEQEMQEIGRSINKEVTDRREKMIQDMAAKNLKAEDAFLAKNKTRKGVHTTASGLEYEVLRPGKGPSPKAGDTVTLKYKVSLLNGQVLHDSFKDGKTSTIPMAKLFPGWREGLEIMHAGSKYRLFVPSKLAFGSQGRRGLPPNSMLILDVELLKVGK
jgi:FKBP-type peptidyl-prolyl cis-trans isomerase FkpA